MAAGLPVYGQVSLVFPVQGRSSLADRSCVPLLVPPDDAAFLETAAEIYAKHDRYPEALALAAKLNSRDLVRKYYDAPSNP
jgi:26S proteasome regulatory subunit N1